MLRTIRIVKEKDQSWKLILDNKEYDISSGDSGIMDILTPKDNQVCMITDLTSENAVCYFIIEGRTLKVFSYPDEVLRVTSNRYLEFFGGFEKDVPYYLIPVS